MTPFRPLAELVRYQTEDGVPLHALLWEPPATARALLVFVPGFGGGFACPHDLGAFASRLSESGFALLAPNLRSVGPAGVLFARFEDCLPDLRAACSLASSRGFADLVLVGDSLGAPRSLHYAAETRDPSLRALVLVGPIPSPYLEAQLRWSEAERRRYDEFLAVARRLTAEGRGREVLTYPEWFPRMPLTLSAATFVSLFGSPEDSRANALVDGPRIELPVLLIHGTRDRRSLPANGEAVFASLTAAPRRDLVPIDCDHFLVSPSEAREAAGVIAAWVEEFL